MPQPQGRCGNNEEQDRRHAEADPQTRDEAGLLGERGAEQATPREPPICRAVLSTPLAVPAWVAETWSMSHPRPKELTPSRLPCPHR